MLPTTARSCRFIREVMVVLLLSLVWLAEPTAASTNVHGNNAAVLPALPFDFEHCLLDLSLSELLRLQKSLNGIAIAQTGLQRINAQPNTTTTQAAAAPPQMLLANTKSSADADAVVESDSAGDGDNCPSQSCQRPYALALVNSNSNNNNNNNNRKQDRGGGYITKPVYTSYHHYHHHPWQPEPEKPSKLQTLFQISITALAFLSFGGYLLCLIVQAIKSKGTTYFHPVATTTTTMVNGGTGVRRIKVYRRSRRSALNVATTQLLPYAFWAAQRAAIKHTHITMNKSETC